MTVLFAFIATYLIIAIVLFVLYQKVLRAFGFVFLLPFLYGVGCAHVARQAAEVSSTPWLYVILGGVLSLGCFSVVIHDFRIRLTTTIGKAVINVVSIVVYGVAYWLNIPKIVGL